MDALSHRYGHACHREWQTKGTPHRAWYFKFFFRVLGSFREAAWVLDHVEAVQEGLRYEAWASRTILSYITYITPLILSTNPSYNIVSPYYRSLTH